jgi:hypothetical protein
MSMDLPTTYMNIFCKTEIQTCLAPQNDCLNLSFVKEIHVVGIKMARSGLKMAIYHSQILGNTLYFKN